MTLLNWQRSIEQIVLTNHGSRILGFTSARPGAGVSLICRRVAHTMSAAGSKTLLIALSDMQTAGPSGNGDRSISSGALRGSIVQSLNGYDFLPGRDSDGRAFNFNAVRLHAMLSTELADYDCIVCDLAPICESGNNTLSSVAASSICDGLLLVCAVGSDRRSEVLEAAKLLRSAGANLCGVVANDYNRKAPLRRLRGMAHAAS